MKMRVLIAALAALLMLPLFGVAVYAEEALPPDGSSTSEVDPTASEPDDPEVPPEGELPLDDSTTSIPATEIGPNPLTPNGTGTVIDYTTDEDGKEFYTVVTPNGNTFYLVIDRQRGQQNVYFLSPATEAELLALAGLPPQENASEPVQPTVPAMPAETAGTEEPEPTTDIFGGNTLALIALVAVVVLGCGGVGYYLKIYRPKHQRRNTEEEFEYTPDADEDDGIPPWEAADAAPWAEDETELDVEVEDDSGDNAEADNESDGDRA